VIAFKYKDGIKELSDIQKLKECSSSRPAL
jgi:hypothetical protein